MYLVLFPAVSLAIKQKTEVEWWIISVWYGNLTVANRNKLDKIVRTAGKISLDKLYHTAALQRAQSIAD